MLVAPLRSNSSSCDVSSIAAQEGKSQMRNITLGIVCLNAPDVWYSIYFCNNGYS